MDTILADICDTCLRAQKLTFIWIVSTAALISLASASNEPVSVDVYWNKSNEIFAGNNDDHRLELALKDQIRFHCPLYDNHWSNTQPREYYVIYRVAKQYYDTCTLPDLSDQSAVSSIRRVLTCNTPESDKFFKTVLERFSPLPGSHGGLTYQPGSTYYFISVSSGTLEGLENRHALTSSCLNHNMKLQLKVLQTGKGPKARIYPTSGSNNSTSNDADRRLTSTHASSHVRRHNNNNNIPRQPDAEQPTTDSIFEKTTELKRKPYPQAIINAEVVLNSTASLPVVSILSLTLSLIINQLMT